ncbi:MAG: SPASM domain-containing protein [Solobacterium sp.]|jgi:radical SAM protein with 4Fe4S-binding SPASM domain|nr:SPASM domain-containing protein [Solobacterium sp.]MCH4049968.1 SPASM domain-containing protein [Solobacterium sp.]MCH4073653.1 SPASM domain-containing protein [Solobacterium sp.]MCI1313142.1 SPASM domain-containing protein [Solobacterium sp.]MCI1346748.1 SPASM domain-containing protein [Solobacterium sp.]
MLKRVYIEITSICNLHCSFCPEVKREKTCMSPAFFVSLLKQIHPYTSYIYLHVQGEPLTHPAFDEIMTACDEEHMQVQLVTNATLLARYHASLLQHPSLRRISFSLQSIEYSSIDVDACMKEILSFCKEASLSGRPECDIRLWRDDTLNCPRTKECLRILRQYPLTPEKRANSYLLMSHVHLSTANSFSWPEDTGIPVTRGTCRGARDQIAILADGTVVPCCMDHDGRIALGNVHEQSFSCIYEGERRKAMAAGFCSDRIIEPYCQTCAFRHRFDR